MLGGGLAGVPGRILPQPTRRPALAQHRADAVVNHWTTTLWALGRCLLPILGLLCLAGVAVNVLQIGFLFLPQRLAFDLVAARSAAGHCAASSPRPAWFNWASASSSYGRPGRGGRGALRPMRVDPRPDRSGPAAIAQQTAQIVFWTAMKVAGALLVLAILDYAYQWWRHEQDLKMTPQELREELRNLEGNPQVIARRKQVQRDLAHGRKK